MNDNIKKIVDIIGLIVGEKYMSDKKKERIATVLQLAIANPQPQVVQNKVVKPEKNEVGKDADKNEIDLQNISHFRFPSEFNLQMEGEEASRKMKIFPDGISESS